jgi:transcription elongation factor Elf1
MDAEFECITCNVKRIVIGVTPVARGYEMRSLECPQCSNLLRLVVRHRRPYTPKTLGRRVAEAAAAPL